MEEKINRDILQLSCILIPFNYSGLINSVISLLFVHFEHFITLNLYTEAVSQCNCSRSTFICSNRKSLQRNRSYKQGSFKNVTQKHI